MKKTAIVSGFLLPSLVIYVAIVTVLTATAARLAMLVIPVAYTLVGWCSYTPFYTAYDFITRQVACAPVERAAWLKVDTHGFAWRSGSLTKAVLIKEGVLVYKEGTYADNSWSKTSTSLLAQGCRFTEVLLTQEGNTVMEFYCRAELIAKPTHFWEYRHKFYG